MHARAVGLLVAVMGILALGGAHPRPATAQGFSLQVRLQMDRVVYEPGAPITFVIEAKNVSAEPVTLTFGTTQRFDVVIQAGNAEVARWSEGRTFAQVLETVVWAPGATVTFSEQWVPSTRAGLTPIPLLPDQFLRPSIYGIYAELRNVGLRPRSAAEALLIGQPLTLATGCSYVISRIPLSATPAFFATMADRPAAIDSLWRYDVASSKFLAYTTAPGAPSDLVTISPGDTIGICVTAPTRFLMPGS